MLMQKYVVFWNLQLNSSLDTPFPLLHFNNYIHSTPYNLHDYFQETTNSQLLTSFQQLHCFLILPSLLDPFSTIARLRHRKYQEQPSRDVLRKRCSENTQQIYRRTPMPKSDFNKVAKQLYWNHILAWVFACKFPAYFQSTFY